MIMSTSNPILYAAYFKQCMHNVLLYIALVKKVDLWQGSVALAVIHTRTHMHTDKELGVAAVSLQ